MISLLMSSRQSVATKVQFDNTNSDRSHVALTRLVPCGSRLVCVCQWISKMTYDISPIRSNDTNAEYYFFGSTSISLLKIRATDNKPH